MECAASSLLIGACICDMGECESANVSGNFLLFFFPLFFFFFFFFFFYMKP